MNVAVAERKTDDGKLDIESIKDRPERLVELTITEKFSIPNDVLADIHLSALKKRFDYLVQHVPVLQRFAEEQGVTEIRSIEDGALLLFPHTIYKSYPLSAIENNRFDRLTKWVNTLTSIDLSDIDASDCDNIDAWIDLLDAQTDIRLRHSSGTTGKLSFIPGSMNERYTAAIGFKRYFEGFGDEPDAHIDGGVGVAPLICFGHRRGAMGTARLLDSIEHYFYNDDSSMIIASNPGRMSADMLSLGGRLEGAQSRGELGKMQLSAGLLARREVFMKEQAEAPKRLEQFFDVIAGLRGKRVVLKGVVPLVVDGAQAAIARGLDHMFTPDSLQFVVGGPKGRKLPDDYPQIVERFTGAPYPRTGYGMSEAASAITRMCPHGHYHIPPNLIPYQLDPKSGAVLPRVGTQTGRYGIIDVGTQTRWGGFLTGDEITISYGDVSPCGCGRKGPYIVGEIRRYSEGEGGDDKITCAGAPGVHDKALEFLSGAVGE